MQKIILIFFISFMFPKNSFSKTSDTETFTLYKINNDKQFDFIQKYHIATFDTKHGLEYNQSNCENFKKLLISIEKKFKDRIYFYTCEIGYVRNEGFQKK